jgi:hypothetical protein
MLRRWWLVFFAIFFALIFLGPLPIVKTFGGYVTDVLLNLSMIPVIFVFNWTARKIRRRFSANIKASTEELSREDDVLLQSTAFSQSVFFIYLNLILSSRLVEILKWTVPTVAVLFYAIRAYAKIKDSPKYRYYSIFLLVAIMTEVVLYALLQIIPTFYVEEHDVVKFYIPLMAGGFFILFLMGISDALKRRYGYIQLKK